MAEIRPFRGLRYDAARVGSLDRVVAPPYDVISVAQQQALHDASPFNVVHLEYGRETGPARYATAARLLSDLFQQKAQKKVMHCRGQTVFSAKAR